MKILLVNPPQRYPKDFYNPRDFRMQIPVGLLYIAAVLEKAGHDVKVLDAFTTGGGDVINTFYDETQIYFGASWETMEAEMAKHEPDVIGISSPFSTQIEMAIKIADMAKRTSPKATTVVGGPHASVLPADVLERSKNVDITVSGEGEKIILDLVRCLEKKGDLSKVKGISYRKGRTLKTNEKAAFITDLDSLPLPAYHLIDVEKYFTFAKNGLKSRPYITSERCVSMITSRGCPFDCIFCSIHLHMGRQWRAHSPEYVLKHLQMLVDKYGVRHISFEDDNLTLDRKRFETILDGIIERKLKISWDTPNGVRADSLDKELLIKAKKSGATRMVVGVESGDQAVLDKIINKSLDLKKVVEVAGACKKVGLNLHTFFMIGLPGEKKENIRKTFDFAWMLMKDYDVIPSFGIAVPLLGTQLYKICEEHRCFAREPTPDNLQLGLHFQARGGMIKTEDFDPDFLSDSIRDFFRRLTRYQFKRPRYVLKMFLQDPKAFIYKASRLMNKASSDKIK